ncbi:MAG: four helix bundle protein [Chloroflexi bacterium]|nr:four helix bundle protein [Chloroflexota bacterium]
MTAGYRGLEVYQLALKLATDIHAMTVALPKIELYEEGSQVRRSVKSVVANIVEGYGRRQYKNEFIKYLVYASASCDETRAHLEILRETGSLDEARYDALEQQCVELGKKLYRFRQAVVSRHNEFKESEPAYMASVDHRSVEGEPEHPAAGHPPGCDEPTGGPAS